MFLIVWEFHTKPSVRRRFVRAYGSTGAWARLFRRAAGYKSTQLLVDPADRCRFFTVDVWSSQAAHRKAVRRWKEDYAVLDAQCARLTTLEKRIASFSV